PDLLRTAPGRRRIECAVSVEAGSWFSPEPRAGLSTMRSSVLRNAVNLPFEFVAIATLDEIADLRARHLDTLLEAQALLLEVWIAESRAFLVVAHGAKCRYFTVHPARGLLEFHLGQPYRISADDVLRGMVERGLAQRAWVKSFDHLF